MGFRINTNIAAMDAHRNSVMTNRGLDSSLGRLSSGLRITKAADDASGLVIADSLRTQASSLSQAVRNGNDAIGIIQTADGALDEYSKILDTIKTKAVQAASDGQNTNSRLAIQKDIDRLMEELNIIATTTSFNGQQLLGGSYTNKEFQVGASSNESVKASIASTQTDKVGHTTRSRLDVGSDQGGAIQLEVRSALTGETVSMKSVDIQANNDPKNGMGALANEINSHAGVTGIRAEAIVETISSGISSGSTGADFSINGIAIGSIVVENNDNSGTLLAAINGKTTETGVSASLTTDGKLQLNSGDGRAIEVTGGVSAVLGSSGKSMSTLGHIELVQAGASEFQISGVGTGAVTNTLTSGAALATVKDSILSSGSSIAAASTFAVGSEIGGLMTGTAAVTSVADSTLRTGSIIGALSNIEAGTTLGATVTVNTDVTLTEDAFIVAGSTLDAATVLGEGTIIQQDFTDNSIDFVKGQVLGADYTLNAALTITSDMTNVFTAGGGASIDAASVLQAGSILGGDTTNISATTLSEDMTIKTGSILTANTTFQAGSTVGGTVTNVAAITVIQDSVIKASSSLASGTEFESGSTIGGALTVAAVTATNFTEDMLVKAGSQLDATTVIAAGTQLNQDMVLAGVNYKAGDIVEQDRTIGVDTILSEDMVLKGSQTATLGVGSILQTNTENSGAVGLSETEFQSLSNIDVTTLDGAMAAMDTVDSAIKDINTVRADLGSVQNQIISTVNNISVTQVNVKAAESQIRDVDFAAESANFARLNILAQSGSYALSQANAVQQNVLRLLQ